MQLDHAHNDDRAEEKVSTEIQSNFHFILFLFIEKFQEYSNDYQRFERFNNIQEDSRIIKLTKEDTISDQKVPEDFDFFLKIKFSNI